MRSLIFIGWAAAIAGCSQSGDNEAAGNNAVANAAQAENPRPAYCFFKEEETEKWKASRDGSGNVVVTGRAYRSDSRYKAVLGEPKVSGDTAEISPTIVDNDTGFGAPGDWWDVKSTIPDSQAVENVKVKCGERTVATLSVPRKK